MGVVLFLALDAVYLGSTSGMWNKLLIRITGEKIQFRIYLRSSMLPFNFLGVMVLFHFPSV